jgi:hypothetical protein
MRFINILCIKEAVFAFYFIKRKVQMYKSIDMKSLINSDLMIIFHNNQFKYKQTVKKNIRSNFINRKILVIIIFYAQGFDRKLISTFQTIPKLLII